ncbi:MAG: hypothetical protein JWO89_3408 [Verrucomicrobiaceae bacterium]|nr:hypothetical protein [Verrucomicrobiaceae bacterium]
MVFPHRARTTPWVGIVRVELFPAPFSRVFYIFDLFDMEWMERVKINKAENTENQYITLKG